MATWWQEFTYVIQYPRANLIKMLTKGQNGYQNGDEHVLCRPGNDFRFSWFSWNGHQENSSCQWKYEMRTVPQGVFKVVSFEMEIRNAMTKRIWQDYCSNKCFIPVSRNTGRIRRCSSILPNIWLFSLRKTVNIDQRYTGQNVRQIACVCGQRISKRSICPYLWKIVAQNNTVHESSKDWIVQYICPDTKLVGMFFVIFETATACQTLTIKLLGLLSNYYKFVIYRKIKLSIKSGTGCMCIPLKKKLKTTDHKISNILNFFQNIIESDILSSASFLIFSVTPIYRGPQDPESAIAI